MIVLLFAEVDTCHDNCGIISYFNNSCSCDWECHLNDNCCSDISSNCPYSKHFILQHSINN